MTMFRLVKSLEGEPAYFLLCDHRQCMDARRGNAVVTNGDDYRLSRREFLKAAIAEGWWVDMEGAFCPMHAQELMHAAKEAEERGKQVVEAPRADQILAFGRARR